MTVTRRYRYVADDGLVELLEAGDRSTVSLRLDQADQDDASSYDFPLGLDDWREVQRFSPWRAAGQAQHLATRALVFEANGLTLEIGDSGDPDEVLIRIAPIGEGHPLAEIAMTIKAEQWDEIVTLPLLTQQT